MSYTIGRNNSIHREYRVPNYSVNSQVIGSPAGSTGSIPGQTPKTTEGIPNITTPGTSRTSPRPGTPMTTPNTGTGTSPSTPMTRPTPGTGTGTSPTTPMTRPTPSNGTGTSPMPGAPMTMPTPGTGTGTSPMPGTPMTRPTPGTGTGTSPMPGAPMTRPTPGTGTGTSPMLGAPMTRPTPGTGTVTSPTTPMTRPTPSNGTGTSPMPGTPMTMPTPGTGTGTSPMPGAPMTMPNTGTGAGMAPPMPPINGSMRNVPPFIYGSPAPVEQVPSTPIPTPIMTTPQTAPSTPQGMQNQNRTPQSMNLNNGSSMSQYTNQGMQPEMNESQPYSNQMLNVFYPPFQGIPNMYLPNSNSYTSPMGIPLYPLYGYDNSMDLDKDVDYMKELYPKSAKFIQKEVDEECDKMEYDGSMMFDEYPDRNDMDRIIDRIYDKVKDLGEKPQVEINSMYFYPPRRNQDFLRDIVTIILLGEIFNRRRRHRSRSRWF